MFKQVILSIYCRMILTRDMNFFLHILQLYENTRSSKLSTEQIPILPFPPHVYTPPHTHLTHTHTHDFWSHLPPRERRLSIAAILCRIKSRSIELTRGISASTSGGHWGQGIACPVRSVSRDQAAVNPAPPTHPTPAFHTPTLLQPELYEKPNPSYCRTTAGLGDSETI